LPEFRAHKFNAKVEANETQEDLGSSKKGNSLGLSFLGCPFFCGAFEALTGIVFRLLNKHLVDQIPTIQISIKINAYPAMASSIRTRLPCIFYPSW